MKAKCITYLLIVFGLSIATSQQSQDLYIELFKNTDYKAFELLDFSLDKEKTMLSQLFNDSYTLQVFNYENDGFAIRLTSRLEEELPYDNSNYIFSKFYYLDFSCSYQIGALGLNLSFENLLNITNNDFSIDPNLATSEGIVTEFYLSHEAVALVSLSVVYNF